MVSVLEFFSFHVCVWTHTCVHVCCTYTGKPEIDVRCLSPSLSILFDETPSLSEPATHQFSKAGWPESSRDSPVPTSPVLRLQSHAAVPTVFVGARNSGLYAKHFTY